MTKPFKRATITMHSGNLSKQAVIEAKDVRFMTGKGYGYWVHDFPIDGNLRLHFLGLVNDKEKPLLDAKDESDPPIPLLAWLRNDNGDLLHDLVEIDIDEIEYDEA